MYQMAHYHPDMLGELMGVIEYLHGNQHEVNKAHFVWKYHENPYTDYPLGIVALHNGSIVGFRGYLATIWNRAAILCAGDTIVLPDHRRKGLSIAMGEKAYDEYKSQYGAIMNFSSTQHSLPGYTKLGFVPLVERVHLYKDGFDRKGNDYGVSEVRELAPYKGADHLISLVRDERFIEWRFRNNKREYKFYKYHEDFVVVGLDPHHNGMILDHTENDTKALSIIIQHILETGIMHGLTIDSFSPCRSFCKVLERLGFKERKKKMVMSVLVRHTQGWLLGGLDIRDAANWELRGIASENV